MKSVTSGFLAASSLLAITAATAQAAPPGAVITNQASFGYQSGAGDPVSVPSNEVSVTVAVTRTPATVELTRVLAGGGGDYLEPVGPSACLQGGNFADLPDPTLLGDITIDPTQAAAVSATESYNVGETVFVRLQDLDQNVDYQVINYVDVTIANDVTGDSELIRLSETGPDTGVFVGYVPTSGGAAVSGDCVLQSAPKSAVDVSYTDPVDSSDSAQDAAQLDPTQRVFESRSGTVISGATVELVDAATGLPATVYGNDGVSQYPSSIISGSDVTDSSGTLYAFADGEYRFPVVPDGDYRIVVTPPPAYIAPSQASEGELQALPGAPYELGPGSFGAEFSKNGGNGTSYDIPVDPNATALFLQKQTTTTIAAPGDFVRYELVLENTSPIGQANGVEIVDRLPSGVRFVAGSVRLDGANAPDPDVSPDLATLTFTIGSVDAGRQVRLSYVVEIVAGSNNDELVNIATAFADGGLVSNESTAAIRLTEELFRTTGTIVGRVLEGDCDQDTFSEDQGVPGIRVYLEDGRFAVSDEGGRFHFDGIEAGTHVAQLDTFTVPDYFDVTGCDETPGYAGRPDSQFVKLSGGSLKRADFYLRRKPAPEGRIDIEMRNFGTESAEQVAYKLTLSGVGNVDIDNINLLIMLPDGVSYESDTLLVSGQRLGEPHQTGQALTMALDAQFGNWTKEISFIGNIDGNTTGELVTKAVANFDTPIAAKQKTPVVETRMIREPGVVENAGYVLDLKFAVLSDELSQSDRAQLDALIDEWRGVSDIRILATGHTDSTPIAARSRHIFADNYALSLARATSAANYIADALKVPAANVQFDGRGPNVPVADNSTAAGRQKNRRVELVMSGIRPMRPSFLEVTQESSGTKETATKGAIPGTEKTAHRNDEELLVGMPASQKTPPLDTLKPGYAMLLPEKGYAPAIPATKVAVQHEPGQTVELTLNDSPVSQLHFEGTATNAAGTVAVSRWQGVGLVDGENKLRAVIRNADGSKARGIRRIINFSGMPIRAEFVEESSVLIADGKTTPVVALRLYDRAGKPSRAGLVGNFRVNAPYRSAWDEQQDRKNALVEIGDRSATYRTGADGIVRLELAPTTRSGEVTVVLPFENQREQEIRAWLSPAQRDWILVGFAEGTAGYKTLADNAVAAAEAGHDDGYYDDGRVAFFAKGSIKGEYLLTLAYDSSRDRDAVRDRFNTEIDPNAYYTLYGDTSEQRFEAASQRKLFVKLERNQFYALFGDYDTGLSVTDLTRYERRFNGFKSEYRGSNVGYTVFAAESDQSFNRDEIRGDGTSGLYRLSKAPIIANSDLVRIEVRDRFDSGVVVSSRKLTRFLDYNLDTLDGTLYFKQPVPSRDLDFNPVFIVVEYESVSTNTEDVIAGGRGSVRFADDAVELGVTHINDATQGAGGEMSGVDMRWQINPQTVLKAEIADSDSTVANVEQSGSAKSVDIEHNGESVDVRAFVREVEEGYGLGYQSAADKGIRRLGVDARMQFGDRWHLEGETGWQQNLESDAIRSLARGAVRYDRDDFGARLGLTHAEDEFEDGETRTSDLVELSVSQEVFDDQLKLRASGSAALGDDAENVDFPARYIVGADYRIVDDVDLVAEYEDAQGRDIDAQMTRLGVKAQPWSRAQVNSFVTNEQSEFGPRLFANVGLIQGLQLNDRWVLDVGVDHAETLLEQEARSLDPDRELPSGSLNEDFTAAFVGATYTADLWSANMRVEHRNSDSEERFSTLLGWYRQPSVGHGLSAGFTAYTVENLQGNELASANLRFGWAYRVADQKWAFLDRVDLIYDRIAAETDEQKSWRLVNNFVANRRISASTELSLQYAFKYVRSVFDGDGYTGYTDLIGADWRHAFHRRWDFGVNTSVYHSYNSRVFDYGVGVDVGFNVASNVWLSLGYNFEGFEDSDFEQARYTAAGPFLRFSIKADQHTLRRIAGR